MEPVLDYRIMEYEMIENRSKNWTENQMKNHLENQSENQIENRIENQIENWNFISKLILPDHIIFHILNQNSDFWHKISSIAGNQLWISDTDGKELAMCKLLFQLTTASALVLLILTALVHYSHQSRTLIGSQDIGSMYWYKIAQAIITCF